MENMQPPDLLNELEQLRPGLEDRAKKVLELAKQVEPSLPTGDSVGVVVRNVQFTNNQTFDVTNVTGTFGDDILSGTRGRDVILALGGNDIVLSLNGNDSIDGGSGSDDIIAGGGDDFVDGGLDNDLIFGDSDLEQDPIFGVSGNDTLLGGDGFDDIFGGFGDDSISGGADDDNLFGLTGNDILNGNQGSDILNGGSGNDTVIGEDGNDRFFAGSGDDELSGGNGNDQINGDVGRDFISGGNDNDTLFGDNDNDTLIGDAGADLVIGGANDDFLDGGSGDDRLIGVEPFVAPFGFGTGEIDVLNGGSGIDGFVLGSGDQVFYDDRGDNDAAAILDFNVGEDFIELPINPRLRVDVTEDNVASDFQVIPSGSARLDSITGTISEPNDFDFYQITIAEGETFSATTVGGASFNTQLFLLDQLGFVLASNDDSQGTLQSTLSTQPGAGTFFVGISSFNNDPVGNPVIGFSNNGSSSGDYTISFTGVEADPTLGVDPAIIADPTLAYSLGESPFGDFPGTTISFQNDIIGVLGGVSPSSLSSISIGENFFFF
jgi:hypothetical protein